MIVITAVCPHCYAPFVSHSSWYCQVGDQILKVCGMPVGQSTHREVVAVIQSRSRVQLKVRSGGLIPVRNRRSEPLSWRVVTQSERGNSGVTELVRRQVEKAESSPKLIPSRSGSGEETDQCTEQRLQISLQGQQGLGCSICKVRAIQQLVTSCGHAQQCPAAERTNNGRGWRFILAQCKFKHKQCKEQNVTQPCCQVVLDLSRPPLPTHQCHVSPAWHPLSSLPPSNIGRRNYAGHEQVAGLHLNAALSYSCVAEADPIHSLVDSSGGGRRAQQTVTHCHHLTRITLICH